MAAFLRWLLGLALLPLCWGILRTLVFALAAAADERGAFSVETVSLLAGMVAFSMCWATISHPVRAYVLGHELTHAMWGLLFGARPSDVRVSAEGGSVKLTKSNFIITLAPYFFPFYTFVVFIAAFATWAILRELPFLPLWLFLVGFTWAFHVLFTLATLTQRQPDVRLYGRVFSWAVIWIANAGLVLAWLAAMTELTFGQLWTRLAGDVPSAYAAVPVAIARAWRFVRGAFAGQG